MQQFTEIRRSHWALWFLVICVGVLGFWHLGDYGEGWDEYSRFWHASEALHIYQDTLLHEPVFQHDNPHTRYHGIWPWALALGTYHAARLLGLPWELRLVGHAYAWGFALLALLAFGWLALRYLRPRTALWAVLLFITQPLLWGHGHINLKDTNMLAGVLVTVTLGLALGDRLDAQPPPRCEPRCPSRGILLLGGLFYLMVLGSLWGLIHAVSASWPSASLPDISPTLVTLAELITAIISTTLLALILSPWLLPQPWRACVRSALGHFARGPLRDPRLALFTLALGLTAGSRVIGWGIGMFFTLYWLHRHQGYGLLVGGTTLLGALVVETIVWPLSWHAPILFPLATLFAVSKFPWGGKVLFAGHFYPANALPPWFVPWLHLIQFTEPLVILSLTGWALLLIRGRRARLLGIALMWYALPVAAVILKRPTLYDNARQLLFLIPPLFLVAGYGWEALERYLPPMVGPLLQGLALLPGLIAIVHLHPYEYVYYNRLVGGVSGAYQRYELDYWATSFHEVAQFLNHQAPIGETVVVWGPLVPLDHALTREFNLCRAKEYHLTPNQTFYAVILVRFHLEETVYPQAPEVFRVTLVNEVPLALVRRVQPDATGYPALLGNGKNDEGGLAAKPEWGIFR